MGRGVSGTLLTAALAPVLLLGACGGPDAPVAPATRDYTLVLTGDEADLPWNRTLYLASTAAGKPGPYGGVVFIDREVKVPGAPGESWHAISEFRPTAAMKRLFWITEARGVWGAEPRIEIPLAPRTGVRVGGDGETELAFADPAGTARFTVVRSARAGQRWAVWDRGVAGSWRGDKMVIYELPFTWREIAPGTWHVCARQEGRQWTWMELELRPGEIRDVDVEARPLGGGTVLTEDPEDELLLEGIILPSHRTSDLTLRARWTGVPPGKRTLRRRDGSTTEIDVVDGETLLVPPLPKPAPTQPPR